MNGTKMNQVAASQAAAALAAMGYYPSEAPARTMIADAIMDICPTVEDSMDLVRRALQLHQEWSKCGIKGLWQIWFSKHKPKNERERALDLAVGSTEAYPDGVPAESESLMLDKPTFLALPAGTAASLDPETEQTVIDLAEAKQMPSALKTHRFVSEDERRVDAQLRQCYGLEAERKPIQREKNLNGKAGE